MMLRHSCNLESEAQAIENAVRNVLAAGHRTSDLVRAGELALGTIEMTDKVLEQLQAS